MKERITAWAERYEAFSLRERALVAAAIVVLMFMLWDAVLLSPEEVQQKQIVSQMKSMNMQTDALNSQIQEMSAALRGGEAKHVNERIGELSSLLAGLEQQQKDLTVEFIQPVQMAGVLRDMLAAEKSLVLIKMESLGAQPLFPREETEQNSGGVNIQKTERASHPEIFKHGMRIVFEGDYFKTLAYLRALEAMPWRLYWDNVEYQVTDYPQASVAITVHTLSLHEGWIGV